MDIARKVEKNHRFSILSADTRRAVCCVQHTFRWTTNSARSNRWSTTLPGRCPSPPGSSSWPLVLGHGPLSARPVSRRERRNRRERPHWPHRFSTSIIIIFAEERRVPHGAKYIWLFSNDNYKVAILFCF